MQAWLRETTGFRPLVSVGLGFLLLVTTHVMVRVALECIPYYDLGIYAEGAYHFSWATPNPWLSGRYIHLFNDHFDPVVALMTPFVRALPLPYGAVLFESAVMTLALWPLAWLVREGRLSGRSSALLAMLMLFHLGTMTALHYPVHPTTWALLPWVWLVCALELRRTGAILAAFVLLMACKEEFPFVAVVLVPLLWQRNLPRAAAGTAICAALWLGFVYVVRPRLLGPIEGYAAVPFAGLVEHPWAYVRERLTQKGLYETLPLFVLPFVPVGVWLFRAAGARLDWGALMLLAPPLLLRMLAQQWHHQYHSVTAAGLTMPFVVALRGRDVPRWVFVSTAILLLASNHERLQDAASLVAPRYVKGRKTWCAPDSARAASLALGRRLLRERAGKRMLMNMNLLPKLVDLRNTFVPPGPPPERDNPFEVVFFEKPPHGMDWPVEFDDISRWLAQWQKQPDIRVLRDDAYVFVAEGSFLVPEK